MLKKLGLMCVFFFLCQSLTASCYLHLDNQTEASQDELLDDPFLILRTKCPNRTKRMSFTQSWQSMAYLMSGETIHLHDQDERPNKEIAFIDEVGSATSLLNPSCVFDHAKPVFHLTTAENLSPHKLWWQISITSDFAHVLPNLDEIEEYKTHIELSDIAETFLNPEQTYYFRARTDCSDWSSSHAFQVIKPEQIKKINFTKEAPNLYKISWEKAKSPTMEYLVFASNAFDFIPDLYTNQHIHAIHQNKLVDYETNQNLKAITHEPYLLIDGSYAYYRIVARDKGQLGVPSSIIYVYDHHLSYTRTVLKQDSIHPDLLNREEISSSYFCFDTFSLPLRPSKDRMSNYGYNPLVPLTVWLELEPFFLPVNHPIKAKLDRIFKSTRAIQSKDNFTHAGFEETKECKVTHIVVGQHLSLKGYLIKAYLDTQPTFSEWIHWLNRIRGSQAIQKCINKYKYTQFKVPQKWIYPLPLEPSPPLDPLYIRKNFILVVEDMHILKHTDNRKAYKKITSELLDQLYVILTEEGLIDSVFPDNIPFTKKGSIAFVDTEHYHEWPVKYDRLDRFLAPSMRDYWLKLTGRQ
jgi:hypothetical protein